MINDVMKDADSRMKSAITSLEEYLMTIRTGRANPSLVERLIVDYYGTPTPLYQMATIAVPEAMLITIKPFDKGALKDIERAIMDSELNLNPNNDGQIIRLSLPPLTQERRRELAKMVSHRVEEAKVALRNVRRDAINDLREFEKESMISEDESHKAQEDVQKMIDKFTEQVDAIGKRKEQEILAV